MPNDCDFNNATCISQKPLILQNLHLYNGICGIMPCTAYIGLLVFPIHFIINNPHASKRQRKEHKPLSHISVNSFYCKVLYPGKYSPSFYFRRLFPPCCQQANFKTGWIPMSRTIFLYSQRCLSEFKHRVKMFASEKGQKYHEAKITLYTVTLQQYLLAYFSKIIMH